MRFLMNVLRTALAPVMEAEELAAVIRALCCELLGIPELDYYMRTPIILTDEQQTVLADAVHRLQQDEPLQYVLGSAPFAGLDIAVDGRVLIPRPETTALVRLVVEQCLPDAAILDVGTGSGCIALALSRNLPLAAVYGCDVSADALSMAKANAERCSLPVTFFAADVLDHEAFGVETEMPMLDVLVSNPPYIRQCESAFMASRVIRWEPSQALFVPDGDPLIFYRALARLGLSDRLRPGGLMAVEINQQFGMETCYIFECHGYRDVRLSYDLYGQPRYVTCRKKD